MSTAHQSTAHGPGDPCTTVHLPHDAGAARVAREQMTSELRSRGCPGPFVMDAEIVLGELVANAYEHGRPNASGEVEVSWCLLGDRLRLSVIDGGDVSELEPKRVGPESPRGRGLHIVDFICDNWSTDNDNGTRVTAELALP
ncbi:ATP-binding protein [Nocardioides flavescens]|uniref:ATP-binding protein n=1 Tax=Nocardioides flavescens TaxID=2691959 RepID=A0A6L7EY22_9ACTN|nr:ATP-binding protein [Nocardioides flavescens]